MKFKLNVIIILGLFLSSFYLINDEEYVKIYDSSKISSYYKLEKSYYMDYYLDQKEIIAGYEYSVRIREYFGFYENDTSYIRKDEQNFYFYDKKKGVEAIFFPRSPIVGFNWMSIDSTWKMTILNIDKKFKTPAKTYRNCVEIKSRRLTNEPDSVYFQYFSKENGYVGAIDSRGKIFSFLEKTVDKNE